jgi:hypothetical protein
MEASIFDKMTNQWKQAGVKRGDEVLMLLSDIWEGQPRGGLETATLRHW